MKLLFILFLVSGYTYAEQVDLMRVYQSPPYDKDALTTAIENVEYLHNCDDANERDGFEILTEYGFYDDIYHLDIYLSPNAGVQYQGATFDVLLKRKSEISLPLEAEHFGKQWIINISGKKRVPKSEIRVYFTTPPNRQFVNGVSKTNINQYCQLINVQKLINEHNK